MEPMRSSLAGCSMDSVVLLVGAAPSVGVEPGGARAGRDLVDHLGTQGLGRALRGVVGHSRPPPSATRGTSISSAVSEPWRLASRFSPVSAGSTKASGA